MPMIGQSGPVPVSEEVANYKPGFLRTAIQTIIDGSTPWDAADHLRQLQYAQAMRPVQAQAMQSYLQDLQGGDQGAQPPPQITPGPVLQGGGGQDQLQPPPQPQSLPETALANLGGALAGTAVAPQVPQMQPPAPAAAPAPPKRFDPYDLNSDRARRRLGAGAALGMPGSAQQIEIAKAAQPSIANFNGWGVNTKDPGSAGKYFEEAPVKGARPVFDENHQPIGWRMSDGSIQSIQASEQAKKLGETLGSPITVNRDDGSTEQMLGRDYFFPPAPGGGAPPAPGGMGGPLPAQRGGQPGAAPRRGITQTPGARAAAEASGRAEGEAGAKARIDYPTVAQRATQSIALIDQLLADPHLKDRVGWGSKMPAIPGGTDAGVEAKLDQLGGSVFLQAYNDLKGAGAITDIEGTKAETAVARLKRHDQSYADYTQALRDLREVVAAGVGRAQGRAQLGQTGGGGSAPPAPPAAQRQANTVYSTPKGDLTWTGTGWRR